MNDSDSEEKKPEDLPEPVEDSAAVERPLEPDARHEAQSPEETYERVNAVSDDDPYEVNIEIDRDPADGPFESLSTDIDDHLDKGRRRLGSEGGEMSFLEHLEDLRGTIFKCLISFLVMGGLMVPIFPYIAEILQWPLARAYGSFEGIERSLVTTRPFEVFSVFIQMIFMGALALSLPLILYFVAQFVAPGLTKEEKSVLRPGLMTAFLLFLSGVAITYFLVLPIALFFLIKFNQQFGFDQLWTAGEYYSMVVWMCLGVGAIFQFPLILILLCYVGILSPELLRSSRRVVVVIVLIVAALITPGGDPLTLLLLSAPLYGLFEGSIVVASLLEKRQNAERAKAETN